MNIAAIFGKDPASLSLHAAQQAERIAALGKAREARRTYFALARLCKRNPLTMALRTFGEPDAWGERRDGVEERDLAREEWRERIWALNRRLA